jgi:hypothetical protein
MTGLDKDFARCRKAGRARATLHPCKPEQRRLPGQAGRANAGLCRLGRLPREGRASFPFHKQPGALQHRWGAREEGSMGGLWGGLGEAGVLKEWQCPQPCPLCSHLQLLPARATTGPQTCYLHSCCFFSKEALTSPFKANANTSFWKLF